jgi:hypothetical protein
MKRIFYLLAIITLLCAAQSSAQEGAEERQLHFQRYDSSYFEKNNSGLEGEKSYLVLANQKQFNKVFGPAARMGKNTFLPRHTFETKIVVASIKRGSMRRYSDVTVTEKDGVLQVSYTAEDDKPGSATYSVPLILAIDKGEYDEVVFIENGERAGAVKLKGNQ